MTPVAEFRPAGPRFRLLFGETTDVPDEPPQRAIGDLFIATPATAGDIFGWGVVYALHARTCIERGRTWQAEHYVGAVRDHALSLACLLHGQQPTQARGYDELPTATLAVFEQAHVAALDKLALRSALAASVEALMHESVQGRLAHAEVIAECWAQLANQG